MAQYTVNFSAGNTGATGLPSTKYKQSGVGLVLPTTKPVKASTTSGNIRTDYTFAYWEGCADGNTTTTSTSTSQSQGYWYGAASSWWSQSPEGITVQPYISVTATRNGSGSNILNATMNLYHTYGDCCGSGFFVTWNGWSSYEDAWINGAVNYMGTTTTVNWSKVFTGMSATSYFDVTIRPYVWTYSAYGYITSCNNGTYKSTSGGTAYWIFPDMQFRVMWRPEGIQVLPAASSYTTIDSSKRQYAAGSTYSIDASITLFPVFTSSQVQLSTDRHVYYDKNTTDAVYGMPGTQTKKQNVSLTLSTGTVPSRSNYIFTGWYSNSSCTSRYTATTYTSNADLTLYAGWRRCDYTISFNTNGYSGVSNMPGTIYKTAGMDIQLPSTVPKKATFEKDDVEYSYKFAYWEANESYTTTSTQTITVPTATTSTSTWDSSSKTWGVMAQWWAVNSELGISVQPKATVSCSRTSSSNVAVAIDFTMIHTYGDCIGCGFWYSTDGGDSWDVSYENPTIHYCGTYSSWTKSFNVSTTADGFINVVVQPFNWYYSSSNYPLHDAYYESGRACCCHSKVYFKVAYSSSYLEVKPASTSYEADGSATRTETITTTSSGTRKVQYQPSSLYKVDQSTNMFVVFTETKTPVPKYKITYNANGGTGAPNDQTKVHNKTIALSSVKPTRADGWEGDVKYRYEFSHWNTNKDNTGTSYSPGVNYTGNAALTLYAIWKKTNITPYTITFNANGGSSVSKTSITHIHDVPTSTSGIVAKTPDTTKKYTVEFSRQGYVGTTKCTHLADYPSNNVSLTFTDTYKWRQKCWNTKADGSGITYPLNFTITFNFDATLYAIYELDSVDKKSIKLHDGDTFHMDLKKEPGFKVYTHPRAKGNADAVFTAIDTVQYTLAGWRSIIDDNFYDKSINQVITSDTSSMGWTNTTNTGSSPGMTYSQMNYRAIVYPRWNRKIVKYGTVDLPKGLTTPATDIYGMYYKFCGWTHQTTINDGYYSITPASDMHVFGIWELVRSDNVMITSDYVASREVLRSWWRLLIECANQKTTDVPTPINIATDSLIPEYRFPEGYDGIVKDTDVNKRTSPMGIINEISKLTLCKDSQNRYWFDGMPDLPIQKINASEVTSSALITKKVRDAITDSLVMMRKWVKVY